MIVARRCLAGAGTNTAALAFGGTPGGACTEAYNGTSWSAVGALSTTRYDSGGAGTSTAALVFGGSPTVTCTEAYTTCIQTCTFTGTITPPPYVGV